MNIGQCTAAIAEVGKHPQEANHILEAVLVELTVGDSQVVRILVVGLVVVGNLKVQHIRLAVVHRQDYHMRLVAVRIRFGNQQVLSRNLKDFDHISLGIVVVEEVISILGFDEGNQQVVISSQWVNLEDDKLTDFEVVEGIEAGMPMVVDLVAVVGIEAGLITEDMAIEVDQVVDLVAVVGFETSLVAVVGIGAELVSGDMAIEADLTFAVLVIEVVPALFDLSVAERGLIIEVNIEFVSDSQWVALQELVVELGISNLEQLEELDQDHSLVVTANPLALMVESFPMLTFSHLVAFKVSFMRNQLVVADGALAVLTQVTRVTVCILKADQAVVEQDLAIVVGNLEPVVFTKDQRVAISLAVSFPYQKLGSFQLLGIQEVADQGRRQAYFKIKIKPRPQQHQLKPDFPKQQYSSYLWRPCATRG